MAPDIRAAHDGPIIPEVGVLALVPDRWGPMWQVRQHVLTRLAGYFHVLWMDPAGGWRQIARRPAADFERHPHHGVPPGFDVQHAEFWLPRVYRSRTLDRWSLRERLRRGRRRLAGRGARSIVLYLWRPEFAPALHLTPHDLSCYHIDDEYSFSAIDLPISDGEEALIRAVDQVFIHSPGLMEKKGGLNPRTDLVPLGVDYSAFAAPHPEPPDLAPIARPRLGYIGVLKRTLDWPLLLELTARHPEWSFVFLGPRGPHPEINAPIEFLARRRNVHFLPPRPTRDLVAYPQHLDVGLMPYVADDYARYGYPLKLHEYLAGGLPAVGTRMRTLEEFRDIIGLASSPAEWSARIREALSEDERGAACRAARQAVARSHDWGRLVQRIAARVAERLGGTPAERYAERAGERTTAPMESSTSATPAP